MRRLSPKDLKEGCRLGLDSHADVHCLGCHERVIEVLEGETCNVQPFNDSYSPMTGVTLVNGCMAFDTLDGRSYILDINEALDFTRTMENSLLCTNQARAHGVIIEDVPRFLDNNSRHYIIFLDDGVELPLLIHCPVSYLPVRYPTDDELSSCRHLELSCHDSSWDPMAFGQGLDYRRKNNSGEASDLYRSLAATVMISAVSHNSYSSLTPEYLAKKWGISLESAKQTITSTSHHSTGPTS